MEKALQKLGAVIFEQVDIRRVWRDEKWYFSIVDVIAALTGSDNPRRYWSDLKRKLKAEGSQLYEKIVQLKMPSADGKSYLTDVADTEQLFRLIQSIPSPKAEPFKLWLARVGYERVQEIADPERSINRARANWQKMGHSQKWIQQRMMGQETRNKLTDYWADHEVTSSREYAILTNIIHSEWSGLSVGEHKALKNLDQQNLRDHMSEAELIFTALAELSTRQIAEGDKAIGLTENSAAAHAGGKIAKDARKKLETRTGKKVVTSKNYLSTGDRKKIK
jgi:prophage antirepressor-like protein